MIKVNDTLEHVVTIEINGRRATLYTASLGSAHAAATAAMCGGALRAWIDGRLVGGPINEIDVDNQ